MIEKNEDLEKCSKWEFIQLIENFNRDKKRKDGLYPQCINCRRDYDLKNLDKIKNYNEQNRQRRNKYL